MRNADVGWSGWVSTFRMYGGWLLVNTEFNPPGVALKSGTVTSVWKPAVTLKPAWAKSNVDVHGPVI